MKTLFIDIETRPALAYVWRTFKENIGVEQIVEPSGLLCFAAMWGDSERVHFYSTWDDGQERMVQAAHDLLNEADAVVHYYGSAFDVPTLNAEFMVQGLSPPAPFHQIDLKKAVDRVMRVTSHKLAFIAPYLKIGEKVKHEGFDLWRGVMEGNRSAQSRMRVYCTQDTRLLKPLHEKLRPWIQDYPNVGKFAGTAAGMTCTRCGSAKIRLQGVRHASTYSYQRYKCMACGGWMKDRKSSRTAGETAVLRAL